MGHTVWPCVSGISLSAVCSGPVHVWRVSGLHCSSQLRNALCVSVHLWVDFWDCSHLMPVTGCPGNMCARVRAELHFEGICPCPTLPAGHLRTACCLEASAIGGEGSLAQLPEPWGPGSLLPVCRGARWGCFLADSSLGGVEPAVACPGPPAGSLWGSHFPSPASASTGVNQQVSPAGATPGQVCDIRCGRRHFLSPSCLPAEGLLFLYLYILFFPFLPER